MHVDVKLQFIGLSKSFSTVFTHAWLLFSVRTTNMTIMRRMRGERAPTMLTLEGLLPTVLTDVCAQNRRSCEGLDAVRTFVWFLSAVYSHVFVEAR